MAIWSTLYSVTDDDGLESTGLRAVFDGMPDLSIGIGAPALLLESGDYLLLESGDYLLLEDDD
jgi:hypothetical protein